MKRYIRSSKYTMREDVIMDDTIYVDVEIDVDELLSVYSSSQMSSFPGKEEFRKRVVELLEDKYHFEVIEDVYDGKLQKGHFSDRGDSISVYFDTYFDLENAQEALDRLGITKIKAPESGTVYCFIHIRISDHTLNDEGDADHRNFLKRNSEKYSLNKSVDLVVDEENIEIPSKELNMYYEEAIEDLETQLDFRIASWVKISELRKKM